MRGTLRAVTAATAALALSTSGLTSCGEEEKKPVTLPSLAPSTATPTSTAGMTDEERTRTIYTDHATNWIDAHHLPPPERRQFLARWTVDPQRSATVDVLADNDAKQLELRGKSVPHIFKL